MHANKQIVNSENCSQYYSTKFLSVTQKTEHVLKNVGNQTVLTTIWGKNSKICLKK